MKSLRFAFIILLILSLVVLGRHFWPEAASEVEIYGVEQPLRRSIQQTIAATGTLQIKDQVKLGSLIPGTLKELYVEENQYVREGQLLAEINTGVGDAEVREAEGQYEKALVALEFQQEEYARQRNLFEEKIISEMKFQEASRIYRQATIDVKIAKAQLDKKIQEYQHRHIIAPSSGIVTGIGVVKGEHISTDLFTTILFYIAPDPTKMEAILVIDERDLGHIKKGQKVQIVVDAFPNKTFTSTIHKVPFTPKEKERENVRIYYAKAEIDNSHLTLCPGMSVTATIDVESVESALSLSSRPFLIKKENLAKAAKLHNKSINPCAIEEKKRLMESHPDKNLQFIWKVNKDCFTEVAVELGTHNNIYYEVLSDLNEEDQFVVEVLEEEEMDRFYEKVSKKF